MRVKLGSISVIPILAAVASASSDTWTVDDDGSADFETIQAAIDESSNGDTIEVYPGWYSGTGYQVIDSLGKSITIRASGTPEETIIDGEGARRVVRCAGGEGADTIIEGFTITGGSASDGGGIYCNNSSPTLTDCTISNNTANNNGGGIYCSGGSPTITDCTISGNTSTGDDYRGMWAWGGGGIFCSTSSPTISGCEISGNTSTDEGGGIYFYYGDPPATSPLVVNCMITNNSADGSGGGIGCSVADPETDDPRSPVIQNCIITGNTAHEGGGVFGALPDYSWDVIAPMIVLDGCTISDNVASTLGGGISLGESRPTINNCIVERNTASAGIENETAGGGILLGPSCNATLTNCIIRDNTTPGGGGGIGLYQSTVSISGCTIETNLALGGGGLGGAESTLTIANCFVIDNLANGGGGIGLYSCNSTLSNCTIGDNDSDYGGGLTFYEGSTTVEACSISGNTANLGGGVYGSWCQIDLVDCHITNNTAALNGGGVMGDLAAVTTLAGTTICGNDSTQIEGAWSDLFGNTISDTCPATCQGDINSDNTVSSSDLQLLIAAWGSADGDIDFDGDGLVDIHDLLTLLERWGACP